MLSLMQYFNDRLYHSKMHFDRIHVKQGKSMPRKRKYMEPAGSTAGEAAALPPSTQTQPDLRFPRTRRPGDKWLKTASEEGSHGGFRYESVHDNRCYPSRSCSPGSGADRYSPYDDAVLPESEIVEKSQALSPKHNSLYCWEAPRAIRRGAQLGDFRKNSVYSFSDLPPSAASRPPQKIEPSYMNDDKASPLISVKRWQWWWYQPQAMVSSKEELKPDSQDSCGILDAHVIPIPDTDDSRDSFCSESSYQSSHRVVGAAAVLLDPRPEHVQGILVKNEDGNGHRFVPYPPGAGNSSAVLDRGQNIPGEGRMLDSRRMPINGSPQPSLRVPSGPGSPGGICRSSSSSKVRTQQSAAATTAEAAGRAKRVWRRWDPSEEQALREAVDVLGTKDWAAIHERMRTDRSIKQVDCSTRLLFLRMYHTVSSLEHNVCKLIARLNPQLDLPAHICFDISPHSAILDSLFETSHSEAIWETESSIAFFF